MTRKEQKLYKIKAYQICSLKNTLMILKYVLLQLNKNKAKTV